MTPYKSKTLILVCVAGIICFVMFFCYSKSLKIVTNLGTILSPMIFPVNILIPNRSVNIERHAVLYSDYYFGGYGVSESGTNSIWCQNTAFGWIFWKCVSFRNVFQNISVARRTDYMQRRSFSCIFDICTKNTISSIEKLSIVTYEHYPSSLICSSIFSHFTKLNAQNYNSANTYESQSNSEDGQDFSPMCR